MKKLYVILSLLILTQTTQAEDCSKCLEVVKAAEEYIVILEAQAVTQGTIQRKLEEKNEQLIKDLAELEARENAWYKNPFLNIALGVLVGVAVSK